MDVVNLISLNSSILCLVWYDLHLTSASSKALEKLGIGHVCHHLSTWHVSDHAIILIVYRYYIGLVAGISIEHLLALLRGHEWVFILSCLLHKLLRVLSFHYLTIRAETLLELTMGAVVTLPLNLNSIFICHSLVPSVAFLLRTWFVVVLGIWLQLLPWLFDNHSHFVTLTDSLEWVFLGTDHHVVAIWVSIAGMRHAFISVFILRYSVLRLSVGLACLIVFEIDFAFRNLIPIRLFFGILLILPYNFVSFCKTWFVGSSIWLLLVDVLLSSGVQFVLIKFIRCISISAL